MSKRIKLRAALAALLIGASLTACSSGGGDAGADQDDGGGGGSGEALVWGSGTWGSDEFSSGTNP